MLQPLQTGLKTVKAGPALVAVLTWHKNFTFPLSARPHPQRRADLKYALWISRLLYRRARLQLLQPARRSRKRRDAARLRNNAASRLHLKLKPAVRFT